MSGSCKWLLVGSLVGDELKKSLCSGETSEAACLRRLEENLKPEYGDHWTPQELRRLFRKGP